MGKAVGFHIVRTVDLGVAGPNRRFKHPPPCRPTKDQQSALLHEIENFLCLTIQYIHAGWSENTTRLSIQLNQRLACTLHFRQLCLRLLTCQFSLSFGVKTTSRVWPGFHQLGKSAGNSAARPFSRPHTAILGCSAAVTL